MKNTLLSLLLLVTSFSIAQNIQEQYQQVKLHYSNEADLQRLESLGIPVKHGVHKRGHFVISEFSTSEVATIRNAGFQVDIMIEDAKEHFLQQNRLGTPYQRNASCEGASNQYVTPANFELGSMGGYLTYQELLDELDQMRTLYPNLITAKDNISNFTTEGQPDSSVSPSIGGNGIQWVRISDNPESSAEGEPQILYTAIHHAREPASLSQLVFYMWYLLENYDSDPEVKSIVDNTELYFVPVVNPDGYLFNQKTDPNGGGFWRKNRKGGNGVDNNRNYNYFINGDPNNSTWGGPGASSNPNSEVYHGPAPFSEVENQAIKWFVETHDFVMAFNNHTSGELLYYPFGYANVATEDDDLYQTITAELTSRNGHNALRDSPFAGDSDDFMYGTVGTHDKIIAFTPEIGTSFWPASNQIIPICNSMMYSNITAAKMINNFAAIEDTAPQFTGNSTNVTQTFNIKRLGISGNGTFNVSIDPVSSNITSVGGPLTFPNLDLLDQTNGSLQFTVSNTIQAGDEITFDLVVNNGTFDSPTRITKNFGTLTAVFEDPANSTSTNFNNNGWGITTSQFVSAPSSITDSPSGDYSNNANETIALSNPIDLTIATGAVASFYARWEVENNWDYVQFQVSTNGGASWTPQCGNYTNNGSNNAGQPTGEPLYDGTQNGWVLEEINLSDYLGQNILVRFQLVSDGVQRADGFYFDDLKISTVDETVLGTTDLINEAFGVYPNPVEDVLNISTALSNYQIDIFNLQGQKVFSAANNDGSTTIDYTGFAQGLYIMRLSSVSHTQTLKIVKK